jgi:branched-chain amino acid transport system substrate-binding protein
VTTVSHPRARLVLPVLVLLAAACGKTEDTPEQRATRAARAQGEIVIGAAWPWAARKEMLYGQGMDLALEELNAGGGVMGRPLRIVRGDDQESVNEGRLVAQSFAQNPDMVAVIGHLQSYVSVPAAAIYDLAGMVMLSPASTDPELTGNQYRRVFRGTFTDREVGRQMATFARDRGYGRVAVYYVRSDYGRGLANAFEEKAATMGVRIAARNSYEAVGEPNVLGIREVLKEWKAMEFDAIFIAGEVPHAAEFVAEARRGGITVPIFGGDAMGTPQLTTIAGAAAEGVIVATAFHPDATRPEVRRFVEAFQRRFGRRPDVAAALGYDGVRVLADAMQRAQSTVPDKVAGALHDTRDWKGVTGSFSFNPQGDLVEKPVQLMVVRDGRFEYYTPPATAAAAVTMR